MINYLWGELIIVNVHKHKENVPKLSEAETSGIAVRLIVNTEIGIGLVTKQLELTHSHKQYENRSHLTYVVIGSRSCIIFSEFSEFVNY